MGAGGSSLYQAQGNSENIINFFKEITQNKGVSPWVRRSRDKRETAQIVSQGP